MNTLVLFSGGVDSTVLCYRALTQLRLQAVMFVDYGQAAAKMEREAVTDWATRMKVPLVLSEVDIYGTDDRMNTGSGSPGLRILPGRNLVLISHATNYAATHGISSVWYGATADDKDYPDCRVEWVETMNALTSRDFGVRVEAPLVGLTKHQVMQEAQRHGLKLSSMWSCYDPVGDLPCGECHSCKERLHAVALLDNM